MTVAGASASLVITAEGTTTITYFAHDNAGNAETSHTLVVRIDKTPPRITATRSPQANAHGWNNSDVAVSFLCSDDLSGLAAGSPPSPVVIASEGAGQSASGNCSDVAGNSTSLTVSGINIDKTAPSIVATRDPAPNRYGWNNTDVTVTYRCADALSGVDNCSAAQVVTTEGAGQIRAGSVTDLAGNTASATLANINIDKTPPTLACNTTPNLLWPPNNKLVPVNTSIAFNDSLSGTFGFQLLSIDSNEADSGSSDIVGLNVGTSSTSGYLRATRLGSGSGRVYTFDYVGTDKAGNSARCTPIVIVPHDRGK
jgi:large repetitive protein